MLKPDDLVDNLDLNYRAVARLRYANIRTIGELIKLTERELLDVRYLGEGILDNIKQGLASEGFSLKSVDR